MKKPIATAQISVKYIPGCVKDKSAIWNDLVQQKCAQVAITAAPKVKAQVFRDGIFQTNKVGIRLVKVTKRER